MCELQHPRLSCLLSNTVFSLLMLCIFWFDQPLDFESSPTYKLQIDARNPEPLKKGLEYGVESTATVSLSVTDVDEVPEFSLDVLHVTVPENTTKGSVLITVEARDPEGKEIR